MADDFEDVLRKFRREMLGSMVSHMSEAQLDEWMKPFDVASAKVDESPGFPRWLQKRFDEERVKLLQTLQTIASLKARRQGEI